MTIDKEFKQFFEDYFSPICRFIERYIVEKEMAADIAQEVFVKVYERWSDFDSLDNAKAFLYTIARNLCLDQLKHKKAENNYLSAYQDEPLIIEPAFLKEVTRQETLRILYAAINQLPPQTRQVILYSLQGDSNIEVGKKMGISINTVKTLKKNAYAFLRDSLSRELITLLLLLKTF